MSNLNRSRVLFHTFFSDLGLNVPQDTGYPRYNVSEVDNKTIVELAVAGYKKEELIVKQEYNSEIQKNILVIEGKKLSEQEVPFIFKGISTKNFRREFIIPEFTEIKEVKLENGILSISLETILPEDKQTKTFEIN